MMQQPARAFRFHWAYFIILVNLALIMATYIVASTDASTTLFRKILKHFTLATELNIATWWSMSLLWLSALFAYEIAVTQTRLTRAAWLALAGLFALLSWDEIGSFHERLGDNGWDGLKPFMVVIGLLIAFSCVTLFTHRSLRRASGLIVLGFVLLGLIPLQEYLTQTARLWPDELVGLAVAVEEGTELLGMSLCLLGVALWRQRTGGITVGKSGFPMPRIIWHFVAVSLALFVVTSIVTYIGGHYTDIPRRGDPTVWYPAIIFLTLAVMAIRARHLSRHATRMTFNILIALSLFLSVSAEYALGRRYLDALPLFSTGLLLVLLAFGVWRLAHSPSRREGILITMLLVLSVASYVLNSFGTTSVLISAILILGVHEALRLRWRQSAVLPAAEIEQSAPVHSAPT